MLVPEPIAVVTTIGPVPAPYGTVAVIWFSEFTKNEAGIPLKVTEETLAKLNPLIVTVVKAGPVAGVNEFTAGSNSVWIKLEITGTPSPVLKSYPAPAAYTPLLPLVMSRKFADPRSG